MKYAIIGLTILFMSCSVLGSKIRVYNEAGIKNIKTVGVITKRFNQPRNPYHKIIKEAFTRTLLEELEKKKLFTIIILDTMENENLNIESFMADTRIDAVLLAEWRLGNPYNMVTDSKVKLSLLDKRTKEILLTSSHGTKLGNSYWLTPSLPRTLLDATEGAIKTMDKNIKAKR